MFGSMAKVAEFDKRSFFRYHSFMLVAMCERFMRLRIARFLFNCIYLNCLAVNASDIAY